MRRFSGDGTPHNPLRITINIDTMYGMAAQESCVSLIERVHCSELHMELLEHHDFFVSGAKHRAALDTMHVDVHVHQRWFRGIVGASGPVYAFL